MSFDCEYCIRYHECGLEDEKNHGYNLRDNKPDCYTPDYTKQVPPWFDPATGCYRCSQHEASDCKKCGVVPFEEHRAQLFTQHAHWDAFFVCSHCGESVRQVLAKCPLCHARMDEQF